MRRQYFAADIKHSKYTIRSSLVKFLFCSIVLYLLINSLIFTANGAKSVEFIVSILAFCLAFIICIYFWIRWKLKKDPKIGKKFDVANMEANPNKFDLTALADYYIHPTMLKYPSPPEKHKGE